MGTSALVKIYDNGQLLVTIYSHYDSYMSGLGKRLSEILAGKTIVNGIPLGDKSQAVFNGPGCMAATVIASLKTETGGTYIQAERDGDENTVNYVYSINVPKLGKGFNIAYGDMEIKVKSYGESVFEGSLAEFTVAVNQADEY